MFQYAAARRIAHQKNVPLKIDILGFETYKLHAYSLQHFNIIEDIATADEVRRLKLRGGRIHKLIRRLRPYYRRKHVIEQGLQYDPHLTQTRADIYLEGYWQSEEYFRDISGIIRAELTVKTPPEGLDASTIDAIAAAGEQSVCLHIRRGDYVSNELTRQIHGVCGLDYYHTAVERLTKTVAHPSFFVFSDDPEWVKENLKLAFPTTYVRHNRADRNFEDMRLMNCCRHHVIANSSFSWWVHGSPAIPGSWYSHRRTGSRRRIEMPRIYAPQAGALFNARKSMDTRNNNDIHNIISRRRFLAAAAAAAGAAVMIGRHALAADTAPAATAAKPNSVFGGVAIGINTYSYRGGNRYRRADPQGLARGRPQRGRAEGNARSARSARCPPRPRKGNCSAPSRPRRNWPSSAQACSPRPPSCARCTTMPASTSTSTNARSGRSDDDINFNFELAKALGCKAITTERSDSLAKKLAPFAEKHKIYVAFHNHTNNVPTIEKLDPLLECGPYIMFNFDIGHYVAGTKGKSPIPVIEKYHDRIISLHLKDRTPEGGNLPWGQGKTPIKEVLQLLKKEKWPIYGDIELEYKIPAGSTSVAEVAKCVAYCREALA